MGIATLVIAAVILFSIGDLSKYGGVFVKSCAGALVVLGLTTLFKGLIKGDRIEFFESTIERKRIVTGFALLAIFLIAIPLTGFLTASFLFYIMMMLALRDESLGAIDAIKLLVQALVVVGAIYWLFYAVLLVPLPGPFWLD